jgi:hypothetical protein
MTTWTQQLKVASPILTKVESNALVASKRVMPVTLPHYAVEVQDAANVAMRAFAAKLFTKPITPTCSPCRITCHSDEERSASGTRCQEKK